MNRLGCCERQSESLAAKKRWTTTCTQPTQKEWIGRMIHWLCGPFCEALPRWLHWTVQPIVAVQSEYTTTKEEILPGAFSKLSINHTFYWSKARQEIAIFYGFNWVVTSSGAANITDLQGNINRITLVFRWGAQNKGKTGPNCHDTLHLHAVVPLAATKGPFCDSKRGWQMTVK